MTLKINTDVISKMLSCCKKKSNKVKNDNESLLEYSSSMDSLYPKEIISIVRQNEYELEKILKSIQLLSLKDDLMDTKYSNPFIQSTRHQMLYQTSSNNEFETARGISDT